ncbi:MAG: hypothetical protein JW888_11355 [Pirellulales bacterium]|nr:hypothetical protein [Pirellulales bacterium]
MALGLLLFGLTGCTPFQTPDVESLLKQPRMSADGLALDVFFVRFPLGDPALNGSAWEEIDEQRLSANCRRHLLANGFRAGVLAGQMPAELAELLGTAEGQSLPGEMCELKAADLVQKPAVVRGHFQLRAGKRREIAVGQQRDELPVLLRDAAGSVSGKSYLQAQPLLAVRAYLLADGRVRLEIVPEISHGKYSQRWAVDTQGAFRLNPGRESRVFEDMKFGAVLSPGHMLVMSTVPSRQGSLGHHFFSEISESSTDQILLLVRLSQTQHDGEFEREIDLAVE